MLEGGAALMSLHLAEAHSSTTQDKLQRVQLILREFVLRPSALRLSRTERGLREERFAGIGSVLLNYTHRNSARVEFASENGYSVITEHNLRPGIDVIPMRLEKYGAFIVRFGDENSGNVYLPHRWEDGGLTLWGGEGTDHLGFDFVCRIEHEAAMLPNPGHLSELTHDRPNLTVIK